MQGKIGREEVARICVAALASPEALDKTFEVKSLFLVSTQPELLNPLTALLLSPRRETLQCCFPAWTPGFMGCSVDQCLLSARWLSGTTRSCLSQGRTAFSLSLVRFVAYPCCLNAKDEKIPSRATKQPGPMHAEARTFWNM